MKNVEFKLHRLTIHTGKHKQAFKLHTLLLNCVTSKQVDGLWNIKEKNLIVLHNKIFFFSAQKDSSKVMLNIKTIP